MKIADFLEPAMVIPDLQGRNKSAVLKEMSEWMALHSQTMNAASLFKALLEREHISSTAIGEGVAIPHGKLPGVERIAGVFARSSQGVDFDSLDGGLTYLFFVLVAPENSAADHLKALARISRLLKDAAFRARLMTGKTQEEIFNTIREEDDRF
ncbi:MAG: PTS sugar transporter subunit IIA [Deltaproteobacteria bacterium]|nr:PTS sugar transporter subunit IIA [Deltaproteobacteria bacterium]